MNLNRSWRGDRSGSERSSIDADAPAEGAVSVDVGLHGDAGTTHNAMSNADDGWVAPNQTHPMKRQLDSFVAVNHDSVGDLFQVVRELNGL
jgi:hypothetical protein